MVRATMTGRCTRRWAGIPRPPWCRSRRTWCATARMPRPSARPDSDSRGVNSVAFNPGNSLLAAADA